MFRQSGHEDGKVVSLTHRPSLHTPPPPPRKYSWYSFLLEAESTPGPKCDRKDYANEKFQRYYRESKPRPSSLWCSASICNRVGCIISGKFGFQSGHSVLFACFMVLSVRPQSGTLRAHALIPSSGIVQTGFGAHTMCDSGVFSSGINQQEFEADRSPLPSSDIKSDWSCTSAPAICLRGMHRDGQTDAAELIARVRHFATAWSAQRALYR
jgi:hypothetical protein